MNLKRIVSAFRRKTPAPTEDSLTLTDEQLKKAKVSSGTLERDILEQREIRKIETPHGRRAFFRGVAGAVGLKVLAEKIPDPFYEDNGLAFFPEFARFFPEAEGHNSRWIGHRPPGRDWFYIKGSQLAESWRRGETGYSTYDHGCWHGTYGFSSHLWRGGRWHETFAIVHDQHCRANHR